MSLSLVKSIRAVPLLLLLAVTAFAQTNQQTLNATLGTPQYSGTGCPTLSASSALSPDGSALSLLFDKFVVDADAHFPTGRKSCNFAVPVQAPTGYRVSIIGIDYRGFNNLPLGATADFSVEYFFAGGSTSPYTRTFTGPLTENYLLEDTLDASNLIWSTCGGASVLRVSNSMQVTTNAAGDQAQSTVDSIEVSVSDPNRYAGMIFYLDWQPCGTTSSAGANAPDLLFMAGLMGLATFALGL